MLGCAMPRRVRLPLESGVSALNNLTAGVVMVPLGLAITGGIAAAGYYFSYVGQIFFYVLAFGLGAVAVGASRVVRAWRERPADLLVDAETMTIEGGPPHARAFTWRQIDASACRVVETYEDVGKGEEKRASGYALEIAETGGKPLPIAVADDPGEVASLRELATLVITHASPAAAADVVTKAESRAAVLACGKCGAPVAPSSSERVMCGRCGESVAMPQDVRARVDAALVVSREAARASSLVATMLDQPGARTTSTALGVSLLVIGDAWPLAAALAFHAWRAHRLDALAGVALVALPLLLVADGFFLSRLRLVDRRALAALTFGFGARPPASQGDPSTCRACGAPLRDASDVVVVRCVFCNADNVTGLDLRATARQTSKHAKSLDDALAARTQERSKWRWRTLASVPLFVATVVLVKDLW
jgi:hypothetical protein